MNEDTITEGAIDAIESVGSRYTDAIQKIIDGADVTITVDGTDIHMSVPNTHRGVLIGLLEDHRAMIDYSVVNARKAMAA